MGDTTQIINAALNTTTKTIIDDSSIDISDMLKILGDKLDSLAFKDIGAIVAIVKKFLEKHREKSIKAQKAKIMQKSLKRLVQNA